MNLFDIVAPLTIEEAKTDYQKRRQRERDVDAGKPVPKQRQLGMTDYQKRRAEQKRQEELGEDDPCWKGYKQVGMKDKAGKQVPNCVPVKEDSWHDGENAWSSEHDQWAKESIETEGWSDAIVSQRTGQPRTPYSVYIKGRKWKDFENDDHAEAVANKLRAKFKAEGRDPSVITIAPTDYDKGMAEAISKKDLLSKVSKDLNTPFKKAKAGKLKSDGKDFTKGDHWQGAGPDDYGYTGYQGHGMPTDKKKGVKEAGSPAQQAAIAIAKKKEQGVAETDPNAPYTPSPAKPFRNPPGFNKQGTGVGNKLAQQTRAELATIQPSKGTPVPAKAFAQGVLKDLKKVNVKEQGVAEGTNYWTKLQNERNTKLNSLVNELVESIKK